MDSLFLNIKLIIHQAKFAVVDSKWSKKVFPYPHHRLYYITDGEAKLKLVDTEIKLLKNHVYLLPAFSLVEAVCKHSMSQYYIHFQTISGFQDNVFEIYKPKLETKAYDCSTRTLFESIIANHVSNSVYSSFVCQGALQLLLAPFFQGITIKNKDITRFSKVLEYIEQNLTQKIKIKTLADIMDLDPVYFSNLFSKVFKTPPLQFILKKRLELAQLLLTGTDKKVREIAFEAGFENEMYFSRLFHQKTGMPPGKYRRLAKQM